jgi:hypothetical protein
MNPLAFRFPGEPVSVIRDFGLVTLDGDRTFSASVSFGQDAGEAVPAPSRHRRSSARSAALLELGALGTRHPAVLPLVSFRSHVAGADGPAKSPGYLLKVTKADLHGPALLLSKHIRRPYRTSLRSRRPLPRSKVPADRDR